MIVVEGADCAGKTTLCKKINELFPDMQYTHFSRLEDSFHRFFGYLPFIKPPMLLDRFFMSEPLYAEARGDVTPMQPHWLSQLTRACMANGCVFVTLLVDDDVIESRWRKDEMYDIELVKKVAQYYRDLQDGGGIWKSSDGREWFFHTDYFVRITKDIDEDAIQPLAERILQFHNSTMGRANYEHHTRYDPVPVAIQEHSNIVIPNGSLTR